MTSSTTPSFQHGTSSAQDTPSARSPSSAQGTPSTRGTSGTAFFLARLAIGTSFFGHGLVRIPKLTTFATHMAAPFQHSILPEGFVLPFAYILPFFEFGIGLLLILGLFTKQALTAGAIVMILLVFGTTTIEQWDNLGSQLIHVAFFAGLLPFVDQHNRFALDNKLSRR